MGQLLYKLGPIKNYFDMSSSEFTQTLLGAVSSEYASQRHTYTFPPPPEKNSYYRGVARNLLRGSEDKKGSLETEVPQWGPGTEPQWRLGRRQMLISSYDGGGGHAAMPPGYAAVLI